jgi:protein-disulfide isomerase
VETGKIRLVSRNFPFLGLESYFAAEATEAAADQGRYWEYKELLFDRLQTEGRAALQPDRLRAAAADLGLDQAAFNAALDQGIYRSVILAELEEAEALGVSAVPTFFVNGKLVPTVPTVEQLGELIEEELRRSR